MLWNKIVSSQDVCHDIKAIVDCDQVFDSTNVKIFTATMRVHINVIINYYWHHIIYIINNKGGLFIVYTNFFPVSCNKSKNGCNCHDGLRGYRTPH